MLQGYFFLQTLEGMQTSYLSFRKIYLTVCEKSLKVSFSTSDRVMERGKAKGEKYRGTKSLMFSESCEQFRIDTVWSIKGQWKMHLEALSWTTSQRVVFAILGILYSIFQTVRRLLSNSLTSSLCLRNCPNRGG